MSLRKLLGAGVLLYSVMDPCGAEACARRPFLRRPIGLFNQCCAPSHGPVCCPPPVCCPAPVCAPAINPCCPPAFPFQTQLQPVTQTTLVPQQVMTYQTVPQIQYQRQAYVTQVPVVTYQPVTQYRDVAVQVNTQVAQVHTRLVPQQSIAYVPATGAMVPGLAIGGVYGGNIAAYGGVAPIPAAGWPSLSYPGEPVPEPVSISPTPVLGAPIPYMQGASAADDWSTIRQRGGVPAGAAPTAATIWQSQLHTGAVAR
jgi:hypothetical protein